MTELNLRARKNALRTITHYENKHNRVIKNQLWHIEGSECESSFDDLIRFIESLDWRYNCGYKIVELPHAYNTKATEICLFCDDRLVGYTPK